MQVINLKSHSVYIIRLKTQVLELKKSSLLLGQQPSGLSSMSQASALLDISVQALEDTQQEGLQPTDMVSLIQLLSLAADIPALADVTNHSQDNIQELSQQFISVADSIISEDNALKWQAIKEVVENCIFRCCTRERLKIVY